MPFLNELAEKLGPRVLRRLFYSPVGPVLVRIYDRVNKNNDKLEVYETKQGFKMLLSPVRFGERGIIYNAYEPEVVALFSSLLHEDSIVFDIGSWIGLYALLAATKARQVIALEVNPDNIARLKDNISLNEGFDRVIKVLNIGASNKKAMAILDVRESTLMNRVRVLDMPERKINRQGAFRVDTLDNITSNLDIKHIDLMMMDIEGHEIYALQGMKELLSKKAVKHLIIEVHPKNLQEIGRKDVEVIQILENSGYNVDKFHKESEAAYHIHGYC
jgi:FkbM family methyltransferase